MGSGQCVKIPLDNSVAKPLCDIIDAGISTIENIKIERLSRRLNEMHGGIIEGANVYTEILGVDILKKLKNGMEELDEAEEELMRRLELDCRQKIAADSLGICDVFGSVIGMVKITKVEKLLLKLKSLEGKQIFDRFKLI